MPTDEQASAARLTAIAERLQQGHYDNHDADLADVAYLLAQIDTLRQDATCTAERIAEVVTPVIQRAEQAEQDRDAARAALEQVRMLAHDCPEHDARLTLDEIQHQTDAALHPDTGQKGCDHKFIDSTHCLKCGWIPTNG